MKRSEMLPHRQYLRIFPFLPVLLVILALAMVACSSPEEPAPGAVAPPPAAAEPAAPAPATAAGEQPVATGDYQAERANCTLQNPCWPDIAETIPASFQEAPMLAERVQRGELPPVEERLPRDPLVIQTTEMIGQYGGTLRRAFTGPGDRQNIERWNNDYTIFWNTGATELTPRIARDWEANEDASEWTFYLREGLRWSDGEPFGADDYIFWYEHILLNPQLTTAIPWYMRWGGEVAVFEKVDDYTFTIRFAQPFPSWPENMASSTVAGHFHKGLTGGAGGGLYAPRHYLEQFHPDFVGEEEATEAAQEAGYDNWHLRFLAMNDPQMNMDVPVMTPWKSVTRIASDEFVLERNPFFYAVDTEGNQLPYFDRVAVELVEELEVLNLRAIAGNYTIQGRHIDFAKLPVIRENEQQGNYFVDFWPSSTRHPVKIGFNQDWNEDEEIAQFTVGSLDFRRALSLAIERDEINETFFLGVGKEASFCPSDTPPYFTSDRWDQQFGRFDPVEANQILDSLGLENRDGEGYRLLPSGRRLTLQIDAVSGAFLDYPSIAEQISQTWAREIGIHMTIRPVERSLWIERSQANQPMMSMFETGEWNPAASPRLLPTDRWAPIAAVWANVPNPDPDDYDGPEWIKQQVAKHWEAMQEPDPDRRRQLLIEGTEIMCDNHARIGMVVDVPVYTTLIKNNVRNVPRPLEWVVYAQTPGNGLPEQMFMIQE
jgi:peptide/nickel transport system substrate-binding protein